MLNALGIIAILTTVHFLTDRTKGLNHMFESHARTVSRPLTV